MTEIRIEITSIVGTSIGALIGALFAYERSITYVDLPSLEAQTKATEAVRSFCLHLDLSNYVRVAWRRMFTKGAIANVKSLEEILLAQFLSPNPSTTSGTRMRELPFDLSITLTDAQTGDPIVIDRDRTGTTTLDSAVRASISIPLLFDEARMEIRGKTHFAWDGGLSGNCRFDIASPHNNDIPTVGSTVTYRGQPIQLKDKSMADWLALIEHINSVFLKNIESFVINTLSDKEIRNLIIVRPDFDDVRTLSFDLEPAKKLDLFENGRQATLDEISKWVGSYSAS